MTGEVQSSHVEEPTNQTDPKSDPKPEEPETKAEPNLDTSDPKDNADHNAAEQSESPGVFGGWGFDVNAVAGNIGGFFSAHDDEEHPSEPQVTERENTDEISSAAANIANVASTEIEHASKAAQETFGKAAEEIGKGWGTLNSFLDDMLTPNVDGEETEDKDMTTNFHSLFPELDQEDQVVDHFKCVLLQKYRCYLNSATPEKTYPMRGRLYISTTHVAMYITDDGGVFGRQPFGFTIAFADVGKILKQPKATNAMMKLVTKSQQSFIFADFESDSHFTGALSLLEHMTTGAAPPQPPTKDVEGSTEKPAAG